MREGSPPPTSHVAHVVVMCHVSYVMCHVSCVSCHMSHVYIFIFFWDKVVKTAGGGSVIKWDSLSSYKTRQGIPVS